MNGEFVVATSFMPFSAISMDQTLEHFNALCKGDGGIVGLTRQWDMLMSWCLSLHHRKYMQHAYDSTHRHKNSSAYDAVGLDSDTNPHAKTVSRHSDVLPWVRRAHLKCVQQLADAFRSYDLDTAVMPELNNVVYNSVADAHTRVSAWPGSTALTASTTTSSPSWRWGPAPRRKNGARCGRWHCRARALRASPTCTTSTTTIRRPPRTRLES